MTSPPASEIRSDHAARAEEDEVNILSCFYPSYIPRSYLTDLDFDGGFTVSEASENEIENEDEPIEEAFARILATIQFFAMGLSTTEGAWIDPTADIVRIFPRVVPIIKSAYAGSIKDENKEPMWYVNINGVQSEYLPYMLRMMGRRLANSTPLRNATRVRTIAMFFQSLSLILAELYVARPINNISDIPGGMRFIREWDRALHKRVHEAFPVDDRDDNFNALTKSYAHMIKNAHESITLVGEHEGLTDKFMVRMNVAHAIFGRSATHTFMEEFVFMYKSLYAQVISKAGSSLNPEKHIKEAFTVSHRDVIDSVVRPFIDLTNKAKERAKRAEVLYTPQKRTLVSETTLMGIVRRGLIGVHLDDPEPSNEHISKPDDIQNPVIRDLCNEVVDKYNKHRVPKGSALIPPLSDSDFTLALSGANKLVQTLEIPEIARITHDDFGIDAALSRVKSQCKPPNLVWVDDGVSIHAHAREIKQLVDIPVGYSARELVRNLFTKRPEVRIPSIPLFVANAASVAIPFGHGDNLASMITYMPGDTKIDGVLASIRTDDEQLHVKSDTGVIAAAIRRYRKELTGVEAGAPRKGDDELLRDLPKWVKEILDGFNLSILRILDLFGASVACVHHANGIINAIIASDTVHAQEVERKLDTHKLREDEIAEFERIAMFEQKESERYIARALEESTNRGQEEEKERNASLRDRKSDISDAMLNVATVAFTLNESVQSHIPIKTTIAQLCASRTRPIYKEVASNISNALQRVESHYRTHHRHRAMIEHIHTIYAALFGIVYAVVKRDKQADTSPGHLLSTLRFIDSRLTEARDIPITKVPSAPLQYRVVSKDATSFLAKLGYRRVFNYTLGGGHEFQWGHVKQFNDLYWDLTQPPDEDTAEQSHGYPEDRLLRELDQELAQREPQWRESDTEDGTAADDVVETDPSPSTRGGTEHSQRPSTRGGTKEEFVICVAAPVEKNAVVRVDIPKMFGGIGDAMREELEKRTGREWEVKFVTPPLQEGENIDLVFSMITPFGGRFPTEDWLRPTEHFLRRRVTLGMKRRPEQKMPWVLVHWTDRRTATLVHVRGGHFGGGSIAEAFIAAVTIRVDKDTLRSEKTPMGLNAPYIIKKYAEDSLVDDPRISKRHQQ